jgi:hypothetical protein
MNSSAPPPSITPPPAAPSPSVPASAESVPPAAVPGPPGRAEIADWLTALGDRPVGEVRERIDSMELAWLVHQVEQRYAVELDDDQLDRIRTIGDAVTVLAEVIPGHD